MSEQILLQGKILGIEEFLLSPAGADEDAPDVLAGRAQWISLLCEALPRALLAELGLARILLGSSGGGQFLLVLPDEARGPAQEFLSAAARDVDRLSNGRLQLLWGITENLGDWSVVRKRLNEELQRWRGTPLAGVGLEAFQPYAAPGAADTGGYFSRPLGLKVREASRDRMVARRARAGLPRQRTRSRQAHLEADAQSLRSTASPAPGTPPRPTTADPPPILATLARRAQGLPAMGRAARRRR